MSEPPRHDVGVGRHRNHEKGPGGTGALLLTVELQPDDVPNQP